MRPEELYTFLESALENAEELANDVDLDAGIRELAQEEAGEWRAMMYAMRANGFFVPGAGVRL